MPRARKSVSPKQLAANRANAAKSTGPLTPQALLRVVEESERLKALRQKSPNEAILDAQPEQKETTCTP